MEEKGLKFGMAGISAILTYLSQSFTPLIIVMALFEIADYATGIASAIKKDGGISKSVALWGAVKKIGYFVLIGVAFLFDYVILETTRMTGLDFQWPAVLGVMSVCYLISTEGISILENLDELGIKVPFLTAALKLYRDKVTKKGEESIVQTAKSNN